MRSGMKMCTGCPVSAPRAAKAMPVLPLVTSTMGWPGTSAPVSSARATMRAATRSLMLPERLKLSSLAYTAPGRPSSR